MSPEIETPTTSDIDVDALESKAFASTNQEIPMTATTPTNGAGGSQTTNGTGAAPADVPTEFTLNVKGEQIKIPLTDPRVTQWLQQGRDYAQRMNEFNQRQKEFESREKWAKEVESVYRPVDEWAKEHPNEWQSFQSEWQNRVQQGQATQEAIDPNNPLARELNDLKAQFKPVLKTVQDLMNEKASQQRTAEDDRLKSDIESVKKTYSNLDFDTPNAEGKSLEYQVLEHAEKTGISNFQIAFRDFYHDKLMQLAEERGKEAVSRDIQKRTKLGLLGQSPTPKKGLTEVYNVKNKSYDDIHHEILEELGIA